MEKRELGKIDFDLIDAAFTSLLQSRRSKSDPRYTPKMAVLTSTDAAHIDHQGRSVVAALPRSEAEARPFAAG